MTSEQLKEWRETYHLTQEHLAQALGVATNTVSRWELGERKIPPFLPLALTTIEKSLSKNK